jgi:hypothetical protein
MGACDVCVCACVMCACVGRRGGREREREKMGEMGTSNENTAVGEEARRRSQQAQHFRFFCRHNDEQTSSESRESRIGFRSKRISYILFCS